MRESGREASREALTGECTGQAIEPRKWPHPGRRRFTCCGRQDGGARQRECSPGPEWSKNLACADARHRIMSFPALTASQLRWASTWPFSIQP